MYHVTIVWSYTFKLIYLNNWLSMSIVFINWLSYTCVNFLNPKNIMKKHSETLPVSPVWHIFIYYQCLNVKKRKEKKDRKDTILVSFKIKKRADFLKADSFNYL